MNEGLSARDRNKALCLKITRGFTNNEKETQLRCKGKTRLEGKAKPYRWGVDKKRHGSATQKEKEMSRTPLLKGQLSSEPDPA